MTDERELRALLEEAEPMIDWIDSDDAAYSGHCSNILREEAKDLLARIKKALTAASENKDA